MGLPIWWPATVDIFSMILYVFCYFVANKLTLSLSLSLSLICSRRSSLVSVKDSPKNEYMFQGKGRDILVKVEIFPLKVHGTRVSW